MPEVEPAPVTRTPLPKSAKHAAGHHRSVKSRSVHSPLLWVFGAAAVVITVLLVVDLVRPAKDAQAPVASGTVSADAPQGLMPNPVPSVVAPGAGLDEQLPAGGPFTQAGTGRYREVGSAGFQAGQGQSRVFTFSVEVEEGVSTVTYGGDDAVAAMVDATLGDPRSWVADAGVGFRHVGVGENPDLRIQLTSPATTHAVCGDSIKIETSCFTSDGNRVVLNESRWVRGSTAFAGDVGSYRQYMINHEVGHGIGYADHVPCAEQGALAPIMMQQTLSLSNSAMHGVDAESAAVYPDDGRICRYNPWPYPRS